MNIELIKLLINPLSLWNIPYLYIINGYCSQWSDDLEWMIDNCEYKINSCTIDFSLPNGETIKVWSANYPYETAHRYGEGKRRKAPSIRVLAKFRALRQTLDRIDRQEKKKEAKIDRGGL